FPRRDAETQRKNAEKTPKKTGFSAFPLRPPRLCGGRSSRTLPLPRQSRRVLVRAFPELAAKTGAERNRGIPELVAHPIRRRQRVPPFFMTLFIEQVHLLAAFGPAGCVNSQQPHLGAGLPIAAEQIAHLAEDFGIELRGARDRMGASDGG